MHEDTSTPATSRPGAALLGGAIAAAGALAMVATIPTLDDLARSSHGAESLIARVLLGLAVIGVLLCLYLALIWGLAAAILLVGPASRTGASLLGLLRVLAPRLARRLAGGAVIATATTALTLAPTLAAQGPALTDPADAGVPFTQSSRLVSAELPGVETGPPADEPTAPAPTDHPPTAPAPPAAAPGGGAPGSTGNGEAPLPSLGWNGGPVPGTTGAPSDSAPTAASSPTAPPETDPSGSERIEPDHAGPEHTGPDHAGPDHAGPDQDSSRIVVVEQGDSLWSISAELLGPESSDPADIAAAWPMLHETNRVLIGEDPGLLHPGQELVIPSSMTSQDIS